MNEHKNDQLTGYFAHRQDILLAVLFGSRARNVSNPQSDLDIGILYETPTLLTVGRDVSNLESQTKIKTDLVILNELPQAKPELAYQIACDAVLLYARSAELFVTYKTACFLAYFDFLPLLQASKQALKQRIINGTYGEARYAR